MDIQPNEEMNVFNLQFPDHCDILELAGFVFTRDVDYLSKIHQLHHRTSSVHEFSIEPTTGNHVITARVTAPAKIRRATLPWHHAQCELKDVELVLSLFTKRDVFCERANVNGAIIRDPREHPGGGILGCSIPYVASPVRSTYVFPYDIGFVDGLNKVLKLIRSRTWQTMFKGGYVLFLARDAFAAHSLDRMFVSYWIIWEHLYGVINPDNLTEKQIEGKRGSEKIAAMLRHFRLVPRKLSQKRIDNIHRYWVRTRNSLIHSGRLPRRALATSDARLFIYLTEYMLAHVLELEKPSNVMNVIEGLNRLLKR